MKSSLILRSILLSGLLVNSSCASTKYDTEKLSNDFKYIRAGEKYLFFDSENKKSSVTVTSVAKDSIVGIQKNQKFAIAKKDIKAIKKDRTALTLVIVAGSVTAIVIVVSAMVKVTKTATEIFIGNE